MNDFVALDLSAAGMRVQRQRMRTIAENIANQHTTGPDGPYQRKQAIIESVAVDFEREMGAAMNPEADSVKSVAVSRIEADSSQPILVHDPSHPDADENGNVLKPNVSAIREMTDMLEASRAYEANLAAARAAQDMLNASMDLLRR
jgi:flagellar basal-body rod protein FlgC